MRKTILAGVLAAAFALPANAGATGEPFCPAGHPVAVGATSVMPADAVTLYEDGAPVVCATMASWS